MRLRRLITDFLDWAFAGLDYDGPLDDPRPAGLISEQLHTNTNTTPVTPFSGAVTGGRALNSRPPLYLVSDHGDASSRGAHHPDSEDGREIGPNEDNVLRMKAAEVRAA